MALQAYTAIYSPYNVDCIIFDMQFSEASETHNLFHAFCRPIDTLFSSSELKAF